MCCCTVAAVLHIVIDILSSQLLTRKNHDGLTVLSVSAANSGYQVIIQLVNIIFFLKTFLKIYAKFVQ